MSIVKLNDSVKIYYEIKGPGLDKKDISTLIFIHGGPGLVDGRLYHSFWGQFASEQLRVIFIDQRGSGRSDDPSSPETLNIKQHAQDIHQFCQKLAIVKPIIAGVSQGGYVALSYAGQFPKDISAVIPCNTEAKRDTDERCKAHEYSLVNYFETSIDEAKQIAAELRKCDENWDAELYKKFLFFYAKNRYRPEEIACCQSHPATWKKFMTEEFPTFDLSDQVRNIICPVLYLVGEFDCVHPPACARHTAELMTKSIRVEFCEIKDTADPVYRDQPEQSANAVREFLSLIK